MENIFAYLIVAGISLLIFYFIIKGAVKEAISDTIKDYERIQTNFLRYLAKQQGMTEEEIEKAWLGQKQWERQQKKK